LLGAGFGSAEGNAIHKIEVRQWGTGGLGSFWWKGGEGGGRGAARGKEKKRQTLQFEKKQTGNKPQKKKNTSGETQTKKKKTKGKNVEKQTPCLSCPEQTLTNKTTTSRVRPHQPPTKNTRNITLEKSYTKKKGAAQIPLPNPHPWDSKGGGGTKKLKKKNPLAETTPG